MVSEWIHTLYGAVRAERLSPPVASRLFAYASVALYEGLAAGTPALPTLAGTLNGLPPLPRAENPEEVDAGLVAVTAEQTVLDSLLDEAMPTTEASLARLADSLAAARPADPDRRTRSEALGRRIGAALVAWSREDGFNQTRGLAYQPPVGPGFWINDSPASIYGAQNLSGATQRVGLDDPSVTLKAGSASDRALVLSRPKRAGLHDLPAVNPAGATEPYWGRLRPFLLTRWNQCPIPDPPAYSTDSSSVLYGHAREVYEIRNSLTPEQKEIALYWADNPGEAATPAGHWIAIASQLTSERNLSAEAAAKLFVVAAVAQADAFIAAWGYKYQFNLIRPRTYIRRVIDPEWEPQISTPAFPEYPAGHSTQSAAAAVVLTAMVGELPFEDSTSVAIGHPVRKFASFTEAADEAGTSRLYGGIHYRMGHTSGQALGRCIGTAVVERLRSVGAL
jgi:hypothetical protein